MLIANTKRKLEQDQNDSRNSRQPSTDNTQLMSSERGGSSSGGRASSSSAGRSSGSGSDSRSRSVCESGLSDEVIRTGDVRSGVGRRENHVGTLIERSVSSVENDSAISVSFSYLREKKRD